MVNDPWPDRVLHNDLTIVLRDGEHVEKFAAMWANPPARAAAPTKRDRDLLERTERFSGRPLVIEGAIA